VPDAGAAPDSVTLDATLVLEDDAVLSPGWACRVRAAFYGGHVPEDWDVLTLFAQSPVAPRPRGPAARAAWPPWRGRRLGPYVVRLGPSRDDARNMGMLAYLVRSPPRAGSRLAETVAKRGELNLDVALNLSLDEVNVYLLRPRVDPVASDVRRRGTDRRGTDRRGTDRPGRLAAAFFAGGRSGGRVSQREGFDFRKARERKAESGKPKAS
jgi:hypothetical protein